MRRPIRHPPATIPRHPATHRHPVPLSVPVGGRWAALQEGPPQAPPLEQSVAMRGVVPQLAPLWVALLEPPGGGPSVRLASAIDCSTKDLMKGAQMRLIWTTTCAMALSISVSARSNSLHF